MYSRPHAIDQRPLKSTQLRFDFREEIARIKSEDAWRLGERNAITLWKGPSLRVVLVAMRAGAAIAEHHSDSPASIQVLEGRLEVTSAGEIHGLGEQQMVTLLAGVPHGVVARVDSVFLLTLGTGAHHSHERDLFEERPPLSRAGGSVVRP